MISHFYISTYPFYLNYFWHQYLFASGYVNNWKHEKMFSDRVGLIDGTAKL